jgi:hypothetical protein
VVSLGVETIIEPGSIGSLAAQSSGDRSDTKALGPSSNYIEVKDTKASTIIMSLCT